MNLQNIDLLALTSADTSTKRTASTEGGNYEGKCPVCGDRDDFYVLPEHVGPDGTRRGVCACRECHPQRMDALAYLEWARKMSYRDAMEYLHEQYSLELPANWNTGRKLMTKATQPAPPAYRIKPLPMSATAPSPIWQERAKKAIARAQELLWDEKIGKEARDYLVSRGITVDTMKAEGLGFVAQDEWDDSLHWGLNPNDVEKVYIPRGILFPYQYKSDVWKVRVRRFGDNIPKGSRYMMVSGSSNGLYRAHRITPNTLTIALFEGEIDALSASQEMDVNDECFVCVATGSTSHARIPKWTMLLGRLPYCLLCFDADDAGTEALTYWQKRLSNASVLAVPPGYKDANEMLTAGGDLCTWLLDAIARVIPPVIPIDTSDTSASESTQQSEIAGDVLATVQSLANVFPSCQVTVLPEGYTLDEHVKRLYTPTAVGHSSVRASLPHQACSCGSCEECASREQLLNWGVAHDWPRLHIRPWLSLPAGEIHWRRYAITHDRAGLEQAFEAAAVVVETYNDLEAVAA